VVLNMKGVYLLLLDVKNDCVVTVGSLGMIKFQKGNYVYVGSAQNGVGKRLERHFRKNKNIRWHIDYMINNPNVKVVSALCKEAPKSEECFLAQNLLKLNLPVKGFGCSDCKCSSHLFKLRELSQFKI